MQQAPEYPERSVLTGRVGPTEASYLTTVLLTVAHIACLVLGGFATLIAGFLLLAVLNGPDGFVVGFAVCLGFGFWCFACSFMLHVAVRISQIGDAIEGLRRSMELPPVTLKPGDQSRGRGGDA